MAYTHALSTNNYGVGKIIVATSAANGTHVTLASAMADAVSGDTIFLRDSVTENVTITPGVNISAWSGGTLNTPTIIGTLTMTAAGTSTISGIRLQTNSAALLAVTGSAASIVNLSNCYLNCTNNTGITFSTSSSSGAINISDCQGDIGTTGIALFAHSSAGNLNILTSFFTNTGGSSTANTASAGTLAIRNSRLTNPLTTSGTNVLSALSYSTINTSAQNATSLTAGGTSGAVNHSNFVSGTASAISVGTSLEIRQSDVNSSNTNAITGAGSVFYTGLTFNSSSAINTTTPTASISVQGINRSYLQPAFLAYVNTTITNVTGDNTVYTIIFDTEVYDQGNNFNLGTSVFTAPVTGKYLFNLTVSVVGGSNINQCGVQLITTARTYRISGALNPALTSVAHGNLSIVADMTANDTATFTIDTSDGGGKIDDVSGLVGGILRTFVSGSLLF